MQILPSVQNPCFRIRWEVSIQPMDTRTCIRIHSEATIRLSDIRRCILMWTVIIMLRWDSSHYIQIILPVTILALVFRLYIPIRETHSTIQPPDISLCIQIYPATRIQQTRFMHSFIIIRVLTMWQTVFMHCSPITVVTITWPVDSGPPRVTQPETAMLPLGHTHYIIIQKGAIWWLLATLLYIIRDSVLLGFTLIPQ